jgi:4'-phosphopantetheinyl transferase
MQQESARAARIVRERDRVLWARSRGVLRALPGRYLDRDPRELCFVLGPCGKPALYDGPGRSVDLRCSLSHSGALALYAVTARRAVGIDVEVASQIDELAIAERVLGGEQARRLARLDPGARESEFLRAWVAHEAAVKCRGTGLATLSPGSLEAGLWTAEVDVGPRAAAVVAVRGGLCDLPCRKWHT